MLLKQLYYMYYNTKPKSFPKRFIVMCFHTNILLNTLLDLCKMLSLQTLRLMYCLDKN
jgi:hypothetical protein